MIRNVDAILPAKKVVVSEGVTRVVIFGVLIEATILKDLSDFGVFILISK